MYCLWFTIAFQRTQTKNTILLYATCIMPLCASNELMANDNHSIVMPPQTKWNWNWKQMHILLDLLELLCHIWWKSRSKTITKCIIIAFILLYLCEMKENSRNSLCSPVNGKFWQLFCLIKTCRKSDYFKIILQMTAIRLFHLNPFFFQLFSYQT